MTSEKITLVSLVWHRGLKMVPCARKKWFAFYMQSHNPLHKITLFQTTAASTVNEDLEQQAKIKYSFKKIKREAIACKLYNL